MTDPRVLAAEKAAIAPLESAPGPGGLAFAGALGLLFAGALGAWGWQLLNGLEVTGLNSPVFWGVYITDFVFFVGVSHAGTLISAILRITDARWRTPYTRMAEMITIASLPFAATCVIVDLGRPERALNVILYPHLTSPILWDVVCISTYVTCSCLYFYTALIPDLAFCRDRWATRAGWRHWLYMVAALEWTDTPLQLRVHNRIMTGMSIALLGLVISVHTNVGFIFGMTIKPGWHTAIIGPYFVIGAALQGLGGLGLIGVILRRVLRLEPFINEHHLNQLRRFTIALICFWTYFTVAELLTTYYGGIPPEMLVFWSKVTGPFAWSFWGMILGCAVIPFILLVFQPGRLTAMLAWSGALINIGMWLERYTIVVPTAASPFIHTLARSYVPSWVEVMISVGWLAGFALLLASFMRVFPVLTLWELREEVEEEHAAEHGAPES